VAVRLKDFFEFAQGWALANPGWETRVLQQATTSNIQSGTSRTRDVWMFFQATVRHRPGAFYESGMHPYCPAVPRMPGIADFTEILIWVLWLLSVPHGTQSPGLANQVITQNRATLEAQVWSNDAAAGRHAELLLPRR